MRCRWAVSILLQIDSDTPQCCRPIQKNRHTRRNTVIRSMWNFLKLAHSSTSPVSMCLNLCFTQSSPSLFPLASIPLMTGREAASVRPAVTCVCVCVHMYMCVCQRPYVTRAAGLSEASGGGGPGSKVNRTGAAPNVMKWAWPICACVIQPAIQEWWTGAWQKHRRTI